MELTAGKRLKAVRELLGLTREVFCDLVGLELSRVSTVENDRGRMSVEDLAAIDSKFPEFTEFIIHGRNISVQALESSNNELCKVAAKRIHKGVIPAGYEMEASIVYGSKNQ